MIRLDAMNKQGLRSDLTFCQVGKKLKDDNPTVVLSEIECGIGKDGFWGINKVEGGEKFNSNRELAMQFGQSQGQINRYISLTTN